jgi:hypothetical protein
MIIVDDCNRIRRRRVRRSGFVLLIVLLSTTMGCQDAESPEGLEEPDYDRGTFGDPYQIVTNEPPATPDEPPSLSSDTLSMQVSYTGGCQDHRFDVDYESERDTTRIWIHHRDGNDSCEEEVLERLDFAIPESALESRTIVLLNPNDDVPFIVRWGTSVTEPPSE